MVAIYWGGLPVLAFFVGVAVSLMVDGGHMWLTARISRQTSQEGVANLVAVAGVFARLPLNGVLLAMMIVWLPEQGIAPSGVIPWAASLESWLPNVTLLIGWFLTHLLLPMIVLDMKGGR